VGLKRITFQAEVTFPADDTRSLDELKSATAQGVASGAADQGGTLARVGITGASQDPDPEPVAEDVVIVTPPPVVD
jgi:hypothetical protein